MQSHNMDLAINTLFHINLENDPRIRVWTPENKLEPVQRSKFFGVFAFDRSQTEPDRRSGRKEWATLKNLERVYEKFPGCYHAANTLLMDDSSDKGYLQPDNFILLQAYDPELPYGTDKNVLENIIPVIDSHFKRLENELKLADEITLCLAHQERASLPENVRMYLNNNRENVSNSSVQDFLELKDNFKLEHQTVLEVSQKSIIDMVVDRGIYIDQTQFLNIDKDTDYERFRWKTLESLHSNNTHKKQSLLQKFKTAKILEQNCSITMDISA